MANFNFNKVILGGRLTADPELKTTGDGHYTTKFTVAVKRKVAKNSEPKTDFFKCVAWRGKAEFITKFFRKGSCICIEGAMQNNCWTDKDGEKHYENVVNVEEADFVDSKGESPASNYTPSEPNETEPNPYSGEPSFEEISGDDEELPF